MPLNRKDKTKELGIGCVASLLPNFAHREAQQTGQKTGLKPLLLFTMGTKYAHLKLKKDK